MANIALDVSPKPVIPGQDSALMARRRGLLIGAKMNREDLAWAAGFFDGEGYIGALPPGKDRIFPTYRIEASISQADPDILMKFQEIIGFGVVRGPFRRKKRNHKPRWAYKARDFEKAQALIAKIWAWLGTTKREQARNAIELYLSSLKALKCPRNLNHMVAQDIRGSPYCRDCASERSHRYWGTSKLDEVICEHKDRPIYARGMCKTCYWKDYYRRNPVAALRRKEQQRLGAARRRQWVKREMEKHSLQDTGGGDAFREAIAGGADNQVGKESTNDPN